MQNALIDRHLSFNVELRNEPNSSLAEAFGQSARLHELIREATDQLGSTEVGIMHPPANSGPPATEGGVTENLERVRKLLREAGTGLATVSETLRLAIRDRTLIDHQLAAAVKQKEDARNAALHDPLTGLPNRVLFKDRLENGIAQAKRHQWMFAVMFVDLDKFKDMNDTYGHLAGDAILKTVAQRLARNARNDDTVSRYGGDEFLCLLTPLHERNDVPKIAGKILRSLQEPYDLNDSDVIVNLSASIGISVFPQNGDGAAALISRADAAMYKAKNSKSGFAFA